MKWRHAEIEMIPEGVTSPRIKATWKPNDLTAGDVEIEVGKLRFGLALYEAERLLAALAAEVAVARNSK